jgi:hypothetical protein
VSTPLQGGNRPSLLELLPKLPVNMVAGWIEELERENAALRQDRAELKMLRELVGLHKNARACVNDATRWLKLMDAWDENAALRKDKERLDWLLGQVNDGMCFECYDRAAIDAARKEGGAT